MPRPWFVAVSGLMGSGKTTLARGLAAELQWRYLPESAPAVHFLTDLFHDPDRWAFETQVAFLVHKAIELGRALTGDDRGIVLDRTISEDVEVFARHFMDSGRIDDRSLSTYTALADHFLAELRTPELVLLCRCPLQEIRVRIQSRGRNYQALYPPGHLEAISALYDDWVKSHDASSVYALDTSEVDTRKTQVLRKVAQEVRLALNRSRDDHAQLELFPQFGANNEGRSTRLLRPIRQAQHLPGFGAVSLPSSKGKRGGLAYPTAYIAAPFTSISTSPPEMPDMLFPPGFRHGVIDQGKYRRFLLSLERSLRRLGVHSFIPHRDINRWGQKQLSAKEATKLCARYVKETDIFFGLLANSAGSHFECGIALAFGKPCVLLQCDEIGESFIASGISDQIGCVNIIRARTLEDLSVQLTTSATQNFLSKYIPIKKKGQP